MKLDVVLTLWLCALMWIVNLNSFSEAAPGVGQNQMIWLDLLVSANSHDDIWSDCGKSSDKATIDSLVFTPSDPERGEDLTVEANVTLKEQVTGGNVEISAKFGFIPVYSDDRDLCEMAEEAGNACPLEKGGVQLILAGHISSHLFHGHYSGEVKVSDQNDDRLLCVEYDLKL